MSKRKKRGGPHGSAGRDASGDEELSLEGLEEEGPEMEPLVDDPAGSSESDPEAGESDPDSGGEPPSADGSEAEQADLLAATPETGGSMSTAARFDEPLPEFRLVRHTFEWADPEPEAAQSGDHDSGPDVQPESPAAGVDAEPQAESIPEPEPGGEALGDGSTDGEVEAELEPEIEAELEEEPDAEVGIPEPPPAEPTPGPGAGQLSLGARPDPGPPDPTADRAEGIEEPRDTSIQDPILVRLASARVAWAEGEQQTALEHLDAALTAEPERLEVLTELGSTMGILGRYEEADRYLRRAQRLAPGDLAVAAQLAIILFRRGLYAAAELELRSITERDPSQADALFYRGEALNRLGRADEALDVLTRVVELEPENPRAYQLLGMLYDRKAMPELATAMYRKARELGRR